MIGMSDKGISLPINMLVVLAISIVVLLAVVAFFMGTFGGQASGIREKGKINACCQDYVAGGYCYKSTTPATSPTASPTAGCASGWCTDWDNDGQQEDCNGLNPPGGWNASCNCP